MTTAVLAPLPPYPSSHARSQLSHTQLVSLNQKISLSLQQTLNLPPQTPNSAALAAPFVSSYARDLAQNSLDALIWAADSQPKPKPETADARAIRARTLLLAERLASQSPSALDPTTLLDLSIAYAAHPARLRALLNLALSNASATTTPSALSAFTALLRSHSTAGLHGLRKAAHAVLCLLRVAPPELLRAFAHSTDFVLALAQAYDAGLGAAASSYGRLRLPAAGAPQHGPDDWEILFLRTKADLLDVFHILVTALATPQPADPALPTEAERAIDIISALHALPVPSRRADDHAPPTAFLNRTLLADYQHAYDLSDKLTHALPQGTARLERLLAVLRDLDADLSGGSSSGARSRDPGAFRLLLLGSGADHVGSDSGVTHTGERAPATSATPSSSSRTAADPRVEEVRAILPDYAPEYVAALLQHAEYGSVERATPTPQPRDEFEFEYTRDRRNVFDGEDMDVSKVRIGKKSDDAMTMLRDRSFVEQMKVDILRRAEVPSDSEEDEGQGLTSSAFRGRGKGKIREVAFDDELEEVGSVRVAGDGEESSSADDDDDDEDVGEPEMSPQTILELAYIANPKRSNATRLHGGAKNVQCSVHRQSKLKEKVLAKHEFSGNKPLAGMSSSGPSSRNHSRTWRGRGEGGRGRRGQNRGRGRGRGRGVATTAGTSGGGEGGGDAQSRAWKDKNKARQANHNRKRGHDKKMSKA
ncbi:hypothetical protein BC826DRAFT_1093328 [Russula brevipes]|nr:hypothetical protein BC826DRAFT_1093328 [Russula brevipes]